MKDNALIPRYECSKGPDNCEIICPECKLIGYMTMKWNAAKYLWEFNYAVNR